MVHCDGGHEVETVKTAIVDGKFGNWCPEHVRGQQRAANGATAQWHRDRDYEDHRRDVIQPMTAQGYINPEFVREYPEEAAEMFSQEEINQANRNV